MSMVFAIALFVTNIDCARRMKVCFECRVQIINKEGLRKSGPKISSGFYFIVM